MRSIAPLGLLLALPALGQVPHERKLIPLDGMAQDEFGSAVAMGADIAAVGAESQIVDGNYGAGAVYVLDAATGRERLKLTASDPTPGASFGTSLALSGDYLVVGAHGAKGAGGLSTGAAYVFDLETGKEVAKLTASDGEPSDLFGAAVAIHRHWVLVGARWKDGIGIDSGAAYLFDLRTGQELHKLSPPDPTHKENFGLTVALGSTTALVGSPGWKGGQGRAFTFDPETGEQRLQLDRADGTWIDGFGVSVSTEGDLALIGMSGNITTTGTAFLYEASTGTEIFEINSLDGEPNDRFGGTVALVGNRMAISAPLKAGGAGAAYVFQTETGLELYKLTASDAQPGDKLWSIAIWRHRVLAGAALADVLGNLSGAAYLYDRGWLESHLNGHWYSHVLGDNGQSAEALAVALGGHLATVRNPAENEWIRSRFAKNGPAWIGYTDTQAEGVFEWTSGEQPGYENWGRGQPDDSPFLADWTVMAPGGQWRDEAALTDTLGVAELISGDCDENGQPDVSEIGWNPSFDWDGDGVLDECTAGPNYCGPAVLNSSGSPGRISAVGSPVLMANNLELVAEDLPENRVALFLNAPESGFLQPPGAKGNLCLSGGLGRFSTQVGWTGMDGVHTAWVDLTSLPRPQGTYEVLRGETWRFQCWFRDEDPGVTSNFTDAIAILFR